MQAAIVRATPDELHGVLCNPSGDNEILPKEYSRLNKSHVSAAWARYPAQGIQPAKQIACFGCLGKASCPRKGEGKGREGKAHQDPPRPPFFLTLKAQAGVRSATARCCRALCSQPQLDFVGAARRRTMISSGIAPDELDPLAACVVCGRTHEEDRP